MIKCEICGREFKNFIGLLIHVNRSHKIKKEDYYLKYINPEKGKCLKCGKDTKFIDNNKGYEKYCCLKCSANSDEVKNKKKETCMKKYGCENPSQCKEFKIKKKENFNKKYGFENPSQIEEVKNKKKETWKKKYGCENPMKNDEIKNKMSSIIKLNFRKIEKKYPLLIKVEGLISGTNNEILGHCKNSNCKNSKENGGYFELTSLQIYWRNYGIYKNDLYYLYCCDECKNECPLFNKSATQLNNLINEDQDMQYNQQEYSTFRNEVLSRQLIENKEHILNYCEKCHSTENLVVHHIQPQKLEPGYALDPPNGIVLCQKCHYEIGHEKGTECSTGNLANKLC